ncbi:MAG: hypothetical protein C5B59_06595 [Bacteroidetes bacterium]|nr:MAG: hypothetical protein C5B59_06595 [Bacteroidota bacterium]
MSTTKRTTARTATDVFGKTIRLLSDKLTSDGGNNQLSYSNLREAVKNHQNDVPVFTRSWGDDIHRRLGRIERAYLKFEADEVISAAKKGPVYAIGCHVFTLAMFNRILRAAGIQTTKTKTVKRFKPFAAAA